LPDSDKALEKVGIFVDVQNIYYTCRQAHNASFDYNKFWAEVTRDREIVCAYAYATDRGDKKQIVSEHPARNRFHGRTESSTKTPRRYRKSRLGCRHCAGRI